MNGDIYTNPERDGGENDGGQGRADSLLGTQSRRAFLARTSALTLAIPAAGVAVASCSSGGPSGGRPAQSDTAGAPAQRRRALHNSDSRLDTAVLTPEHHVGTSATGGPAAAAADVPYRRWAPELPSTTSGGVRVHLHARETPVRVDDEIVVAAWTFDGDVPAPIIHARVGEPVEITLTNDVVIPHSIDLHAARINPKDAFRSVVKGESHTFTFTPKRAGAFMYHCGTAPVLMHIGSGMFGAIIVSPRNPLPPAKEFVIVQNEYYLANVANGVRASDYDKMLDTMPDLVCFNGRPNQYLKDPIRVKVGDRVRFWVVSAGPSHPCSFHVIGQQFDTVYLGEPPGNALHGVQTFNVAPGGGMVFELSCDFAGEFPFVNHGFGHGQKGAIGMLVVEA